LVEPVLAWGGGIIKHPDNRPLSTMGRLFMGKFLQGQFASEGYGVAFISRTKISKSWILSCFR
jgi:hypothetical protein